MTREEGQQQRRDQKALATSVRGGATEGRARKTDDQESERTLGPRFNEVADELAAIGRATDTSSDELPQSTAELSDRFGRALQAIGDAELADWQGFELMQT